MDKFYLSIFCENVCIAMQISQFYATSAECRASYCCKIFCIRVHLHCLSKKVSRLMCDNNCGRCGPFFKILSPDDL